MRGMFQILGRILLKLTSVPEYAEIWRRCSIVLTREERDNKTEIDYSEDRGIERL